ncbi:MAG TPA: hypothetical protein VF767_04365 [Bryobacteraceae bacterium]
MKKPPLYTIAIAAALLTATGCGKKDPAAGPAPASAPAASAPAASPSGQSDYSKPALTEEKLTRFIESMQEEKNPLEFIFKSGGGMRSAAEMKAKEIELNAYARKYGFKDYLEYIDTWGRVMVGQMQVGAAKMFSGMAEGARKNIQEAEAKLKDPSLSPGQRKLYVEQAEQGKRSLAELTQANANGLNAADLALVEKFNDRLNEAARKRRGR